MLDATEFEKRFTTHMRNRLLDSAYQTIDSYHSFIHDVKQTQENVLKFFIITLCKDICKPNLELYNHTQLVALFIFHLYGTFKQKNVCFINRSDVLAKNIELFDAEQEYWLYITSGYTEETAKFFYDSMVMRINAKYRPVFSIKIEVHPMEKEKGNIFRCSICLDNPTDSHKVILDCSHMFCYSCIEKSLYFCKENEKTPNCPLCRHQYRAINVSSETIKYKLEKFT